MVTSAVERGVKPVSVAEIAELEDRRFAAMFAGDVETLEDLLDDELYYCHSRGNLDTKESFLANLTRGPVGYVGGERSDTNTRLFGDTAVVTGRARLDVTVGGEPLELNLRYLAVWSRVGAEWRFQAWQSTPAQ